MILITRPIEPAKKLQLQFNETGIQSFIESLTSIKISDRKINLQDCIYLITSQYAVKYLQNKNILLNQSEFIIIGQETSNKLKRLGAKKIIYTVEDSDQLFKYLEKNKIKKKITYLCGSNRNQFFIKNLKKIHRIVSIRQVYEVIFLKTLSKKLITKLKKKKINTVLIFSLNNARLFLKLCKMRNDVNYADLKYICISKNIYQFMIQNSCKNTTYSSKPTEKSVINKTLGFFKKSVKYKCQ